jgi:hypothetical protein
VQAALGGERQGGDEAAFPDHVDDGGAIEHLHAGAREHFGRLDAEVVAVDRRDRRGEPRVGDVADRTAHLDQFIDDLLGKTEDDLAAVAGNEIVQAQAGGRVAANVGTGLEQYGLGAGTRRRDPGRDAGHPAPNHDDITIEISHRLRTSLCTCIQVHRHFEPSQDKRLESRSPQARGSPKGWINSAITIS